MWLRWRRDGIGRGKLVLPVDRRSSNSTLLPPTPVELANLAQKAKSIKPAAFPAGDNDSPIRSLQRRLSPQKRAELVARYISGENTPALCIEYGISKCGLLHLLRKAGVTMRKQPVTLRDAKQAAMLYESGLSITEIVEQIGYSYSTVRKSLHESGVEMRPKGIKRSSLNKG